MMARFHGELVLIPAQDEDKEQYELRLLKFSLL